MTFPQAPLDADVELDLAGTWTEITSFALQRDGTSPPISITRGRADETAQATPSSCQMQWNNRDGRFSPRNPVGPYYGQLTRNTPVRISVPASGTALRLEDDTVSYAVSSSLAVITTDIDLRIELNLSGWALAGIMEQASWAVVLNGDGTIGLMVNGSVAGSSTMPLPLGHIALRITRVAASGLMTFYTSPTIGGSWTQLGNTVSTTPGGFSAGSGPLVVGQGSPAAGITGLVYEMQMYSGIAGTLKADPKFSAQTAGTTSFTDAQSNTWTLTGTATINARSYRFHGECSSLPQQWDLSGNDVWTPVTAAGILRRKQQGSSPIGSAMRRVITAWPSAASASGSGVTQSTIAYWPCEDASGSTQVASGISANADGITPSPMLFAGTPSFQGSAGSASADSVFACSAQLMQPGSAVLNVAVPAYSTTASAWAVTFLVAIPSGGIPNAVLLTASMQGGSSIPYLALTYNTASGGKLSMDVGGVGTVTGPTGVNGNAYLVQLLNVGTGPNAYLNVLPLGLGATPFSANAGFAGGNVTRIQVNSDVVALGATEIGHIWVSAGGSTGGVWSVGIPDVGGNQGDVAIIQAPLNAYVSETAGNRFARLCGEENIAARVYGYPNTTSSMGAQQIDTLVNILQSCEDADRGQIYEPAQCLGLGYRTSASMCNQAAAVSLDYSQAHIGDGQAGLVPTDDDQYTVNDVTASRNSGSSARVQVTSGPLSVNAPPNGAGDYNTSITLYCQYDSQLPDIAGWMTHTGTADAERFPVISLNLARTELASLTYTIQNAGIGDYLSIANPPAWLPPGPVKLLIWGVTEKIGGFFQLVAWNAVPEIPFEVAVSDDVVFGRADTDGSTLHATVASGITLLALDTTNTASPKWTTAAGDFPFDLGLGGEQVTVTDLNGPPANFLTGNNAGFDSGTGNWTAAGNSSIAQTTAQAHSGAGSLQITSVASGNMAAASCTAGNIATQGLPCTAGDTIAVGGWFLAATSGRSAEVGATFYTSGGALISSLFAPAVTDSTTGWVKASGSVTAPATSGFCRLSAQVLSTGAGSEVHYFDDGYIGDVTTGGTSQTATVTRSVNGVAKSQAAGTSVALYHAPIAALI